MEGFLEFLKLKTAMKSFSSGMVTGQAVGCTLHPGCHIKIGAQYAALYDSAALLDWRALSH